LDGKYRVLWPVTQRRTQEIYRGSPALWQRLEAHSESYWYENDSIDSKSCPEVFHPDPKGTQEEFRAIKEENYGNLTVIND
jgi:hypothetical protein